MIYLLGKSQMLVRYDITWQCYGNAMELEVDEWVEVTIVDDITGVCENPALSSLDSSSFPLPVLVMVLHILVLTA